MHQRLPRGEMLERWNHHLYDRGGMRRVHLRGRENILKRLVVHAGAANLGLLMRKMFGCGTPRALHGRLRALATATDRGKTLVRAILGLCAASFRLSGGLIAFSSPTPAALRRSEKRQFHHGLLARLPVAAVETLPVRRHP